MEAGGIEPPLNSNANNCQCSGYENSIDPCAAPVLQFCGSNCQFVASLDTDLQSVIFIWDRLPKSIRNAIVALVDSQEGIEQ